MKPTEMLTKITSLLSAKIELESMKLENGTVLEAENFTSGESVFIVTEDEKVPLPVGDYELENGKMLMVAEEGIIGEIADAVTESQEEETEDLDSQVATGSEPRDVEAEKDTEEEPKAKKSKKDLSDENEAEIQEEENLDEHEKEEEKDEMNKIVEEVVAAVTPIIDEMKQELAYVKEELGKMKDEELAKQEVKEQLSSEPPTKAIKHNPDAKTENKRKVFSNKRNANSTMDRVLHRMSNINNK